MRIDAAYNFLVFILRKERNGFISIAEFNQVAPRAQLDTIGDYYDVYAINQKMHDALSPIKTKYDFTKTTSPSGIITLPSDYLHLLNGYTVTYNNSRGVSTKNNIRFVNEDEVVNAGNSQLRQPSVIKPIGINDAGTIQLTPEIPQAGRIWYLKYPSDPVYAYTLVGRTITYDAVNSVQFALSDIYQNKIIAKLLSYSGINLNDDKIVQYSQLMNKETE